MATPTDMMIQMLLAQVTDLQRRVMTLEAAAAATAAATANAKMPSLRGPGPVAAAPAAFHASGPRNTVKHSVPLQSGGAGRSNATDSKPRGKPRIGATGGAPRAERTERPERTGPPPVALTAILNDGEDVTMTIGTGKDEEGNFTNTTCVAVFEGEQFTVTEAELAPELVNQTFKTPGEALYKFMDQLKQNGHIKRTFSVAPWKLCSVERDGKTVTLQDLRNSTA
jgi:hypothetical protein